MINHRDKPGPKNMISLWYDVVCVATIIHDGVGLWIQYLLADLVAPPFFSLRPPTGSF